MVLVFATFAKALETESTSKEDKPAPEDAAHKRGRGKLFFITILLLLH